jgi:hypothetical protein
MGLPRSIGAPAEHEAKILELDILASADASEKNLIIRHNGEKSVKEQTILTLLTLRVTRINIQSKK